VLIRALAKAQETFFSYTVMTGVWIGKKKQPSGEERDLVKYSHNL
jgi:hypothetical protein